MYIEFFTSEKHPADIRHILYDEQLILSDIQSCIETQIAYRVPPYEMGPDERPTVRVPEYILLFEEFQEFVMFEERLLHPSLAVNQFRVEFDAIAGIGFCQTDHFFQCALTEAIILIQEAYIFSSCMIQAEIACNRHSAMFL